MGREGPQRAALPAQQLLDPETGGRRMKRQVRGLAETARDSRPEIPDGIFLVRVDGAQFRWHMSKPFYVLRLSVVERPTLAGQPIVGGLYCTQISQYLSCPRRYRHRYLDGWQEKDTRAAMLFGRSFEQAVAALFRRE